MDGWMVGWMDGWMDGFEPNLHIYMYHWKTVIPTLFKKAKGILLSPPLSVRPLCYLLLNHWTKLSQIWCVSYSHVLDCNGKLFWSRPLGP